MTVKELIEKLEPLKENVNEIEFTVIDSGWPSTCEIHIKVERGIVEIEIML